MQTITQAAATLGNPNGDRYYTQAELDAQYAADIERKKLARLTAREQITAGASPFRVYRDKIVAYHGTALRLQAVGLNLYNSGVWARRKGVHLDNLIANADAEHVEILIDLLRSYAKRGENDADFLALGRELAEANAPRPRKGARA